MYLITLRTFSLSNVVILLVINKKFLKLFFTKISLKLQFYETSLYNSNSYCDRKNISDLLRYNIIDFLSVYVEKFKTPTIIFSLVLSMLQSVMNF